MSNNRSKILEGSNLRDKRSRVISTKVLFEMDLIDSGAGTLALRLLAVTALFGGIVRHLEAIGAAFTVSFTAATERAVVAFEGTVIIVRTRGKFRTLLQQSDIPDRDHERCGFVETHMCSKLC